MPVAQRPTILGPNQWTSSVVRSNDLDPNTMNAELCSLARLDLHWSTRPKMATGLCLDQDPCPLRVVEQVFYSQSISPSIQPVLLSTLPHENPSFELFLADAPATGSTSSSLPSIQRSWQVTGVRHGLSSSPVRPVGSSPIDLVDLIAQDLRRA